MSQDNQSITLLASFLQKGLWSNRLFLKHSTLCTFLVFLGLTLGFYYPTIGAGFVTDVTSGIERIQRQPLRNIIHSFGFPALNQVSILGFYLLYTFFGLNGWVWYLAFGILHALNAYLSVALFRRLFWHFKINQATIISLIGALLFLMHPYQTEVLVWRACLNYLLVTTFILSSLFYLIRYLETADKQYFWGIHGFFLLALFTFELSLILPLLTIVFYVAWESNTKPKGQISFHFRQVSFPQFALLGSYFLLNKWVIGQWIGHYGAATHLKLSLTTMGNTLLKYCLKYLFFVRSYPHQYKKIIFNYCDQYGSLLIFLLLIGVFIFLLYLRNQAKINTSKIAIYILLIAAFIITLLPVLNLYFYWIQNIENDRYGYLASVFGLMSLSLLLFQLPKRLSYFLLIIYLSASLFLLVNTNQAWKNSTEVFYSLLNNYRWQEAENVIILNAPDNYKGAYLFRIIGRKSGFQDALQYIHQTEVTGKIWEVTQYNMVHPTDGVNVSTNKTQQLKVTFNQWGNWFWRNGIGAGPTHQRSTYTAHFKGQYYLLDLKNPPANTVFIYQDGKEWKEFKMMNDD